MVKCIDKHNKFTKSLLGADSRAVSTRTTWTQMPLAVIPQFASLRFLLAHFLSVSAGVFQ